MLEILLVFMLCKAMGKLLRAKARNPLPFQILTAVYHLNLSNHTFS